MKCNLCGSGMGTSARGFIECPHCDTPCSERPADCPLCQRGSGKNADGIGPRTQ